MTDADRCDVCGRRYDDKRPVHETHRRPGHNCRACGRRLPAPRAGAPRHLRGFDGTMPACGAIGSVRTTADLGAVTCRKCMGTWWFSVAGKWQAATT